MATVAAMAATKVLQVPLVLDSRVLLYDGVCNLCNAGVRFVAERDPQGAIKFCSVQSKTAEAYLKGIGMSRQDVLQRFVFVELSEYSVASTAALRVCGYMRFPWPLMKAFLAVPEPFRDAVYDMVAAHRYRLFGRTRECQVPPAHLLERFLDRHELVHGRCRNDADQQQQ